MQHTPEPNVFLHSCKSKHDYTCTDSGYSGFFQSPADISLLDSSKSLSGGEDNEMSKENQRLTAMSRVKAKDLRATQQPSLLSWTETPKRQSSLQHRLQMCRPLDSTRLPSTAVAEETERTRSPCAARSRPGSQHWISTSFDSLDALTGSFVSDLLTLEPDVKQMGRKRRLFAQMRTSTREDGKHIPFISGRTISLLGTDVESPASIKDVLSPSTKEVNQLRLSVNDQSDVLSTPASIQTPKYVR